MSRIFYSLSGEGRGHATRVRVVVDELCKENDIRIYASGMALDFLGSIYAQSNVEVVPVPGLRFQYTQSNKVSYLSCGFEAINYMARMPRAIEQLERDIVQDSPDLAIVDFEPLLPRAAKRTGLPLVSLDHQHFLLTYQLDSLPPYLQRHAAIMGQLVRTCCSGQQESIVSSFYFPPLRKGLDNVTQIGPLLRPEIVSIAPEDFGHVTVYLRRFAVPEVITALQSCGRPVRIYGLSQQPSTSNLEFCRIDDDRFVEDLATCSLLVSTAGNQLVGEALYFGKPVLVMPEPGNHEQAINAHFLEKSGTGQQVAMDAVTGNLIRKMLQEADKYTRRIDRTRLNGNPTAVALLNARLAREAVPVFA